LISDYENFGTLGVFIEDSPGSRYLGRRRLVPFLPETVRNENQSSLVLSIRKRHPNLERLEFVKSISKITELLFVRMLSVITQDAEKTIKFGLIGLGQLIEELLGWVCASTVAGERNPEHLPAIYQPSFGAQLPTSEY
jgi:hypothetical protein